MSDRKISQLLVEIKSECENILIKFGHGPHHPNKADICSAISTLANNQLELAKIILNLMGVERESF